MRLPFLLPLLLVGVAFAAPDDRKEQPAAGPRAPDLFMLYSSAPKVQGKGVVARGLVRVVPLRQGQLPDLAKGQLLDVGETRGPARTRLLRDGSVLVVKARSYLRFDAAVGAPLKLVTNAPWPTGWWDVGASDLNRDGHLDLVLVRKDPGYLGKYRYKVARGKEGGSWDFSAAPLPLTAEPRFWLQLTLGDVNKDGRLDLVFQSQPHNRVCPLDVKTLWGNGDGTFQPLEKWRRIFKTDRPGSNIVPADFNRDGFVDLFLTPDDDVPDHGQAHMAWGSKTGFGPPLAHVDFEPKAEGPRHDEGRFVTQASDVDLDGHLDLVVYWRSWVTGQYRVAIRRGSPDGKTFGARETLLEGVSSPQTQPTLSWPTLDGGNAGGGIWSEGHW